ncbi:MAG: glycosyltransferase [Clostridia bacterium]|nr:glycosyltransferase [Clostridia bacterium]
MCPKVSIIVPVYKAELHISACIESILAQAYSDFELLLVDDGSPDKSGIICDDYAKRDTRIKVFHKENGGVSTARNLGIEKACGEWIAFIDSDDVVGHRFLNSIEEATDNNDIIHFGYQKELSNKTLVQLCKFLNRKDINKNELFKAGVFSSCSVSYFFRRSFIERNGLRFNETLKYSEDREFIMCSALLTSNTIVLTNNTEYIYKFNSSSATTQKRDYIHCKSDIIVLDNIFSIIEEKNIILNNEARSYISRMLIDNFIHSVSNCCKKNSYDINVLVSDLKNICESHENIDRNFGTYKRFISFPRLTIAYYRVKFQIKKLIKKV